MAVPIFNPLDKGAALTLSNGDRDFSSPGTGGFGSVRATDYKITGKHYVEFEVVSTTAANPDIGFGIANETASLTTYFGNSASSAMIWGWGGGTFANGFTVANNLDYGGMVAGDRFMIAWDCEAGKAWVGKNNVWGGSGDPAAGINPWLTWTPDSRRIYPGGVTNETANGVGRLPATTSYAPPSGFTNYNTTDTAVDPNITGTLAVNEGDDTGSFAANTTIPPAGSFTANGYCCVGDSLTDGTYWTPGNEYWAKLATLTGKTALNRGESGRNLQDMVSLTYATDYNAATCDTMIAWGGINDLFDDKVDGVTASTLQGWMQTWAANAKAVGWKFVACTITPSELGMYDYTSYDDTQRVAYNDWLRANWQTFADGFADLDGISAFYPAGNTANPTYYADGVHLNAAANDLIAAEVESATTADPTAGVTGTFAITEGADYGDFAIVTTIQATFNVTEVSDSAAFAASLGSSNALASLSVTEGRDTGRFYAEAVGAVVEDETDDTNAARQRRLRRALLAQRGKKDFDYPIIGTMNVAEGADSASFRVVLGKTPALVLDIPDDEYDEEEVLLYLREVMGIDIVDAT